MDQQREIRDRNWTLAFRIYVVVYTYLAVGLIWGFVPIDWGNDIFNFPVGLLFTQDAAFMQLMKDVTNAYLIYAALIGALGAILSLGTRDVYEVLALFFLGMLPKERKYWGVVFDQHSGRPVAFVPVRLFEYKGEGKPKLLAQTVTDTEGRYRLHVDKPGEHRYTIEIHYPGYEPVMNDVQQYLAIGNYELVSDIPLMRSKTVTNRFKQLFFRYRARLYNLLFITVYISYILLLILSILLSVDGLIFVNVLPVISGIITVVWNTRIVRNRFKPAIGKVVDVDTKQPVSSALVNVYANEAKTISAVTDSDGIVKLNIPSGIYQTLVSAKDYLLLGGDPKGLKVVKIGKDGYIDKDLLLKRSADGGAATNANLLNPFK